MRKNLDLIWIASLMVIGITSLILAGTAIVGVNLPAFLVRILGYLDLIALPFFAFSTVIKLRKH